MNATIHERCGQEEAGVTAGTWFPVVGAVRQFDSGDVLNVILRPAGSEDAPRVAAVLVETRRVFMPYAPAAHPEPELREWVANVLVPSGGVTVAELQAQVVGIMATECADQGSWITQMAVDPTQVNRGVGTLLLAHAKRTLPLPIRLYTFQANSGARRFYERHGFIPTEFTDGQGNEERCPDALYELHALEAASRR